jgi:hypothetical protein
VSIIAATRSRCARPHIVKLPPHSSPQSAEDDERKHFDIEPWDVEFCKVDQSTLFDIIMAANYLDIKKLLDITCKTVANMIKGETRRAAVPLPRP